MKLCPSAQISQSLPFLHMYTQRLQSRVVLYIYIFVSVSHTVSFSLSNFTFAYVCARLFIQVNIAVSPSLFCIQAKQRIDKNSKCIHQIVSLFNVFYAAHFIMQSCPSILYGCHWNIVSNSIYIQKSPKQIPNNRLVTSY